MKDVNLWIATSSLANHQIAWIRVHTAASEIVRNLTDDGKVCWPNCNFGLPFWMCFSDFSCCVNRRTWNGLIHVLQSEPTILDNRIYFWQTFCEHLATPVLSLYSSQLNCRSHWCRQDLNGFRLFGYDTVPSDGFVWLEWFDSESVTLLLARRRFEPEAACGWVSKSEDSFASEKSCIKLLSADSVWGCVDSDTLCKAVSSV